MNVSAIGGTVAAQNGSSHFTANTVVVTTKPAGPSLSTVRDSGGHVITTTSIGPSASTAAQGNDGTALHVTA